jgi:hypothetical protein
MQFAKNEVQFKRVALQNVYGSHLSMRLQMEESILSNFQRLPTLKSEFVGLSTSLGLDEEIGFSDFLRGTLRLCHFSHLRARPCY